MERRLAAMLFVDALGSAWCMGASKAGPVTRLEAPRAGAIVPTVAGHESRRA